MPTAKKIKLKISSLLLLAITPLAYVLKSVDKIKKSKSRSMIQQIQNTIFITNLFNNGLAPLVPARMEGWNPENYLVTIICFEATIVLSTNKE